MSATALIKARVIVGTLMAAATVASTGIATSLAIAHTRQQADAATDSPSDTTDSVPTPRATRPSATKGPNTSSATRKSSTNQSFTPARPATQAPAPTHTKSKGS